MTAEVFDKIIDERCKKTKETLSRKAMEYASDEDRLHNFKRAGEKRSQTPEQALRGMHVKHEVSIDDMVDTIEESPQELTFKWIDEKIGDSINYLVLLEGLLKERLYKKGLV